MLYSAGLTTTRKHSVSIIRVWESAVTAPVRPLRLVSKHPAKILFQMLPYPFLDARNNSESCKKYTDTPMWNSTLSNRIEPLTKVDKCRPDHICYSPVEAREFTDFPPAYIEITDLKKYNRATGSLFCIFGIVFIISGIPMMEGQNSAMILISILGVMFEVIAAMIVYTLVIEKKYKKK